MPDSLKSITYQIHEKLLLLDAELRVIDASPAYYKAFNVTPAETLNRQLGELGDRQWNNRIKSSLLDNPRVTKVIPEFVAGLPGEVDKITDLLNHNDLAALQNVVHQLRGSSGGYGFDAVTAPATKAEESIKAGSALESITAEIKSLIEIVRRIDGYDESKESVATGTNVK